MHFSAIRTVNTFPAIKQMTPKILTAFSATAPCMPWVTSAEVISITQKRALRTAANAAFPTRGIILAILQANTTKSWRLQRRTAGIQIRDNLG